MWLIAGATALAVVLVAVATTLVVRKVAHSDNPSQSQTSTTATTFSDLTLVPNHPPISTDFNSWIRFGGIDATLSDNGQTVRLDTHDTVDTWTTKWSGLIREAAPTACSLRGSTGRVRDISHSPGVAGGYGIGIANVDGASGSQWPAWPGRPVRLRATGLASCELSVRRRFRVDRLCAGQ